MHQKKSETQQQVASDLNPTPPLYLPPNHQNHLQIHAQSNSLSTIIHFVSNQSKPHPHLTLHNPPTQPHQNQFHREPISSNPSASQTLRSAPHRRPIMAQAPSTVSYCSPPTPINNSHHKTLDVQSSSPSFSHSTPSYSISFAKKALALKFFRHLRCARLLRARFRFLILLCLPSLYYFVSNPRRSFILDFLSLLVFSAALLISLNLELPRLPSIRLFFGRSFPIKFFSASCPSKPYPPVLWSIGSKPELVKRPNSGSSVQVYSNGDVYEGEFHKGKCSGSGVYHYHRRGRYEGDWIDEKYDGYGVETWAKGSRYRGQYRQGLRHGIGLYRFYTGDVYAGEWSNGQCHGCGVHTCVDGSQYVGEFKWGVKHGLGRYHFRNRDTYAGEYFADKMHGFGVYQFGNGHRYEGSWHEGRRQGFGLYTFRNGETQSGHWQNGVLDIPCLQLTCHGSPYAVNYTKVLNAVQEAQRAAEKAFDVGKMDEKVNRAMAAANKAANAARVAAVKAVQNKMHLGINIDETPIPSV
ncbi:hypothetical protein F2P56_004289 [Juglans regia]|uniref:Uncharacterized protein n=2 Tax=Juglans regia TaxID=51240 RepID=A0A833Y7Q6_JUGRE|nr:uncharacterized protein LOC108991594 isoform X2 [Juglans regia]KAF5477672.1 hypothetical protein F2P56_004289 [Juglans regia]